MKFLILNGPNVNLQRYSELGMPGELDYNGMMDYVQSGCDQMGIETDVCQTNHEGDLIDEIQAAAGRVDGIVLNPGGYAHTSVAILDALRLCGVPAVEVLLTAPDEREPFRKTDVVSFDTSSARDPRVTCTPVPIWPSCCAWTAPPKPIS